MLFCYVVDPKLSNLFAALKKYIPMADSSSSMLLLEIRTASLNSLVNNRGSSGVRGWCCGRSELFGHSFRIAEQRTCSNLRLWSSQVWRLQLATIHVACTNPEMIWSGIVTRHLTTLFLATLLLSFIGCTSLTPEEQARSRRYDEEQERAASQRYVSSLKDKCLQYGFSAGSNAFAQCVQLADQTARADRAKKERDDATYWCRVSNPYNLSVCDPNAPKPTVTNCSRDFFGNVSCFTR